MLIQQHITYAQLSEIINVADHTVAMFMCGAANSRRLAEKIADALGLTLQYSKGEYTIVITDENKK